MKLSDRVKPIRSLKAHPADIVRDMEAHGEPLVITRRGEAKVVLQDIRSYEQTQETIALPKLLAPGERQLEAAKVQPAPDVFGRFRAAPGQRRGDPSKVSRDCERTPLTES